jgi:predicted ATPase/transcriptional regulator with XRE-family HTH domain
MRTRLTQEGLAARAGVGVATLSALERDARQRPHSHTLSLLADALELATDERAAFVALATAPVRQASGAGGHTLAAAPSTGLVRLPQALTTLIGRDTDVASTRALLEPTTGSRRLVTLVGPAGVGKTRLATAVAAELAAAYADGVMFIDLAPLADPRLVPATIARALGMREGDGRSAHDMLLEHLKRRQVLLVLDNFEHLLEAGPSVVEILRGCPRVAELVTSRAALRVQGEWRVEVKPLATPMSAGGDTPAAIEASPAVELFVQRGQAVATGFKLTPDNAPAVAGICRQLDGLPLAIELAAARVRFLPPTSLLPRLERRLLVLTGGAVDLPQRQRTLRATLAWSVDLLRPTEYALFRRLAVFAGGWSIEAVEAVAADIQGDVLDALQMLVDCSLVQQVSEPTPEPRFRLLETLREYALEQLETFGEAQHLRARHAAYFLTLAEQAEPHLRGADQRLWFDRLDCELDNLRVALAWARSSGNLELGLRLAIAVAVFCEERGHVREGREWLDALLAELPDSTGPEHLAPLHARALATSAWLSFLLGDCARAASLADQSLARWHQLGQVGNSPLALNVLAFVARLEGDLERHEALFEQSLTLCRAEGDVHGCAEVLSWLGTKPRAPDEVDAAIALLEESLQLYQTTGTIGGMAFALLHLGAAARCRRDVVRAQTLFEQSLALYESLGDRSDVAYVNGALGSLAADKGDLVRARSLCEASLATFRDLGDARGVRSEVRLLGRIAGLQGDDRTAVAAYAECLALRLDMGGPDLAFSLEGLALALVHIAAQEQQPSRLQAAVRLLGAAAALREAHGGATKRYWALSLPLDTVAFHAQQVAATRAVVGDAEFEAAWDAGRRLSVEEAIAEAQVASATLLPHRPTP